MTKNWRTRPSPWCAARRNRTTPRSGARLSRSTTVHNDPRELFEGTDALSDQDAIELRSELARLLSRDEFPVDRAALLAILDDKGATPPLVALVSSRLPEGQRYDSTPELLAALGLAHVEEEPGS